MTEDQRYRPWLSLQAAAQLVKQALGDDKNTAATP